jgi:hypothetical protein
MKCLSMQLSSVSNYVFLLASPREIPTIKSNAVVSQRVMTGNVNKNRNVFLLQSLARHFPWLALRRFK